MYTQLASKLLVSEEGQVSPAVAMDGGNAVSVELTVFALTGTTPKLTVTLQVSNDLENWADEGNVEIINVSVPGYHEDASTSANLIAATFVRLKYFMTGTASPTAIVAAGLNVADL